MKLSPLLLLPVLAWSLSQAPEPADAARKTADQAKPAEDSPNAARVTPELVKLWRKQAAQGDAQAQTRLGLLYSTGNGVPHDPGEAIKWFRKAAEQGDGLGQILLATKYLEGDGVARDPVKGAAWAILAAEEFYRVIYGVLDGGTGRTVSNNPEITPNLTPAEVNQVKQLASELRKKIEARGATFDLSHLLGDHPGTRIVAGFPLTGDEGKKTSPQAPGALNFGAIEFVSKPGPEPSPPFKVGIVEANGNLVPVATFDGEDWSHIDLAEDWRNGTRVKSTGEWTLWYENPGPSPESPHRALSWIDRLSSVRIEIATTGVIASEPRCNHGDRIFAMATDAGDRSKSLIECDYCCPEPKRGFATTSNSPPDRVTRLDPESEDGRRIAAQILDTFNELENKALEGTPYYEFDDKTFECIDTDKTLAEHLEPRLSAEKRFRLPLRFDKVFRIQGINTTYYYIEVNRSYYDQLREECNEGMTGYSLLQGWVLATADELVWLTQSFALTDPDMKGQQFDRPILFWRRGNVVDVLVNRSHWDGGWYIILTIDDDTVNE